LADGLVKEDDAADRRLDAGGREQQLAVRAPVLFGRFDVDARQPFLDVIVF